MAARFKGPGNPQDAPKFPVSSLTFTAGDLAYNNGGTLTACGNGTDVEFLIVEDVASADTEANVIRLKDGDLIEVDYTGAITNLKIFDFVDMASATQANAADETVVVERLQVVGIDSVRAKLLCRYQG